MQKTSLLGNSLIWFGAAISIAEIITGGLLAPLGLWKAMTVIVTGHLIGCTLLFFAGWIGAKYHITSMESVKRSFGVKGGIIFAVLNLVQLVGWSTVMIAAGSHSACGIWGLSPRIWSCIIGSLIFIWIVLKSKELKILNTASVVLLFTLTIVLGIIILQSKTVTPKIQGAGLRFGDALELTIAMPLSWLPLIADYTCDSSKPKTVSLLSAVIYFLTSGWMYFIGLTAVLFAGETDITLILSKAGLGIPALLIIVLSTVTATYLDVFSAEMSVQSITKKISPHMTGFIVCISGVLMAIFCHTAMFEQFLYWIGSVFAPMIAILITDFFILKQANAEQYPFKISNLVIWAIGFCVYRIFLMWNPICGSTLPAMLLTAFLQIIYQKNSVCSAKKRKK